MNFFEWLFSMWTYIGEDRVNCGMGGDEKCKLYRNQYGHYKCVTQAKDGQWTHVTYHDEW